MEGVRATTLFPGTLVKPKSDFEKFLINYSEVAYIYTAVPTFLLTIIGLLTGVLLFVHKSQYDECKHSNDTLLAFLLGQMIFFYTFALIYSNLLFQLLPNLHSLTVTFSLFISYFTLNTGWSLWGIAVLTTTGCENSVYAGIASFDIAFTLAFDLVLVVGCIVVAIKSRRSLTTVHKEEEIMSEAKPMENKSSIDDVGAAAKEGWKEENLDDF